jgi:hypothetical protein
MALRRDRVRDDFDRRDLIEADHLGMAFWPAIDPAIGCVQLLRMMPDGVPAAIWRRYAGEAEAHDIYYWMNVRPDHWHYWGRLVILFGDQTLEVVIVHESMLEAEIRAAEAEQERLEQDKRDRLHQKIELYIIDERYERPGLSLESGDETKPFFVMNFSEKWERERILDWMRWQRARFIEFRDLNGSKGAAALERAIIAGMRVTENDVKAKGLAAGGRRPLRFWRGE